VSLVPPEVLAAVRRGRAVLFLAHLSPDGDVLGSQLGLGLALRGAGREVTFACAHPVPGEFHFLPGAAQVEQWKEGRVGFDLVVVLDCPDPARLGGLLEGCRGPRTVVVNIDHHADNRRFGDVNWIEPSASATGEMVADLLVAAALPLTPEVAVNLFTAVATDTGSFRYSNATPKAFRLAARLVELGADPAAIAGELYESRDLAGLRRLGELLGRIAVNPAGTVAWLVLDREALADPDLPGGEDFVTYPRSLRGVKVALLFREFEGEVKVSLRAKGEVDVARIAARFGGGGHPNAAGCVVPGGLDAVKARLLQAVEEALAAG